LTKAIKFNSLPTLNIEVLAQAAEHAQTVHGVSVTPELAEGLKSLIREEA